MRVNAIFSLNITRERRVELDVNREPSSFCDFITDSLGGSSKRTSLF